MGVEMCIECWIGGGMVKWVVKYGVCGRCGNDNVWQLVVFFFKQKTAYEI